MSLDQNQPDTASPASTRSRNGDHTPRQPLAIVGIGCRFPKADSLEAYWSNIKRGIDAITDIPPTHWRPEDYFDNDKNAPDMTYARRGGFLEPIDFDPLEFGIAPNNLEATDTTQLLGMLAARDALRDAGYETGTGVGDGKPFDRDRCSVIMGVTGTLELVIPLGARLGHPIWRRALKEAGVDDAIADDVVQRIADGYVPWQENSFPGLLGNVAAGRIANRFDLGGSNCVVDAACASSLSAIHMAAMELWSGKADMAITGGLDTFNDIFMYMCFSKTPALSPTGNARPFAAEGDGTILGEGLGLVIIKRLDDALRDGDKVYAVIRGIGSSSDGRGNAIYAPSAKGQTKALRNAYRDADVTPDTIELIEAHGTGTKVGDATEVRALKEVYGEVAPSNQTPLGEGPPSALRPPPSLPPSRPWCAVGSVKSMVGHTKAAAGAAGLIKAAMALNRRVLPPTIKVDAPLAEFSDPQSPVYVNTTARPWVSSDNHPRRAAVSAFGFGGSNFHCVLEEPPAVARRALPEDQIDFDGRVIIAPFSADSTGELTDAVAAIDPARDWSSLRKSAVSWRAAFNASQRHRLVLVIERDRTNLPQLIQRARAMLESQPDAPHWATPDGAFYAQGDCAGQLAVLFPGQGSQRVGMLRDLACQFPHMIDALDAANAAFDQHDHEGDVRRLSDYIYPIPAYTDDARDADDLALRDTRVAQPALGAVSAGAWRVLAHYGVKPDAAAGHSFGELVALWAAGRIDDATLHHIANARGQAMAAVADATDTHGEHQHVDRGAMLAVAAPLDRVEPLLAQEAPDVVVANHNAPQQVVLSGPTEQIDRLATLLTERGLRGKRLPVAAAFHSSLVAAAERPFSQTLADIAIAPGSIDVYANTTGECYPPDADAARRLLAGQLARPVRFVRQIQTMYAAGVRTFVEVGPGRTLTGLVGAILAEHEHHAIAMDPTGDDSGRGQYNLACALGRLAALGHAMDLTRWDSHPPTSDAKPDGKRRMTVQLSGANYVSPRKKPTKPAPVKQAQPAAAPKVSAAPPAPLAAAPVSQEKAAPANTTPSAPRSTPPRAPQPVATVPAAPPHRSPATPPSTKPLSTPPNNPPAGPLAEALRVTQQSVLALQRMQEQTAALHRQYLEGQQAAHQTVRQLLEQQQRLISASLGQPVQAMPVQPMVTAQEPPPSYQPPQSIPLTPAPTFDPFSVEEPVAAPAPVVPAFTATRAAAPPPAQPTAAPAPAPRPAPAFAPTPTFDIPHPKSDIQRVLLEVVAEKTGYPVEMLDLDMSLDADLGIDSIKRVEILSSLQERMPDAPPVKPEDLGVLQTLRQIVGYIEGASPAGTSRATAPTPPSPKSDAPPPTSDIAHPTSDIQQVLLEVVAEKTGYPVEMLDLDMSLDADLGIDSIKRVEILSALQERMPDAPQVKPEDLGVLSTLRQIVDFIGGAAGDTPPRASAPALGGAADGPPSPPAPPAATTAHASPRASAPAARDLSVLLQRLTVAPAVIAPAAARPPLHLPRGATVWITDDGALAPAVQAVLAARGLDAVIIPLDHAPDPAIDQPAGLVVLSPAQPQSDGADARFVASAFDLIQRVGSSLRESAARGGALLATVARLDASLGLESNQTIARPVTGALAGIVKTAAIEWPQVTCKAIDIGNQSHTDQGAVERLIAELLHEGPVEVALTPTLTQSIQLIDEATPAPSGRAPLGPDDVIVITGGARGVTAAAAIAVARAWRPRVLLLGRSHEPTPEPDWLINLRDEAAIKQAIIARQSGERMTPRAIDDACRKHLSNREARRTIAAIEEAGARVVYRSVDVRDSAAVAAAIDEARRTLGPIRALIHGAGVLADRLIEDKTPEQFDAVFSTKIEGLLNLLAATREDDLRAIALYSSSTARFGRKGQVDYAAANEALNKLAQREARMRDNCRVVSINWGPWDGGMVTPALKRVFESEGVNVIPIDAGADLLVRELSAPANSPVEVVVLGAGSKVMEGQGKGQGPGAKGQGGARSTAAMPQATPLTPATSSPPPSALRSPSSSPTLGPWPSALSPVFHREITLERYPFLRSHVLNGRPVLPVAVMIEWLAHGALHDNPGMVFVGLHDLRVFKGVVLDATDAQATTVRIMAGAPVSHDAVDYVPVELRSGDTLHARAWIALGLTHAPGQPSDAPAPHDAYARGMADAYEDGRLFHGPDMQAVREVIACDSVGIVGQAAGAPPVSAWMHQPMRSTWLADPMAIDAAFQLVILWTQQERGQGSLPTAVGAYRQHQRAFPRDGVRIITRVTKLTDHAAEADIDFIDAAGRLVASMHRYECVIDESLNDTFARNRLPIEVGS